MKRRFMILVAIMSLVSAKAATIRDFFISEPGHIFELLSQGARAAMVTMAEAGEMIKCDNRLEGKSQILELDSTYLKMMCSERKTIELRLLTSKTDTVIAVVETVKLPVTDSHISFYGTDWEPRPVSAHIKGGAPSLQQMMKGTTSKIKAQEVLADIDFAMMSMTFTGENHDVLEVTSNLKRFYGAERYAAWAPYMNEQLRYKIDKLKLVPLRK